MGGSGLGDGDGGFLGEGEWLNRRLVNNHVNGGGVLFWFHSHAHGVGWQPHRTREHVRKNIQTSFAPIPSENVSE